MTTSTKTVKGKKEIWKTNIILLLLVAVITLVPFVLQKHGDFLGTDDKAEKTITEIKPDYNPWFESVWTPPSGEIESLLFALQAGVGCLIIGYYIGYVRGRTKKEDKT
ncbi:energy-coupling factor ABC transporter substrate-binding protein [Pseudobacteroides cellulosolvens]|uniref:Cobalt transport protein CbiN n=1 Tax=Pseudobacteroides cellulosolvens ATCC 35603 = DSM 2933 TaxID=398512 RepID=A0A0L6JRJ5_9FIRM|nr:energy-coupling factor ABC transporter substrate-binding protein [Pseudobacteroides cellulosolvens]KNY28017.1 Cobalt transport protein cbiN [Pseudobacteroides cellulosolvens ATCC 35603 = DSM 2933]